MKAIRYYRQRFAGAIILLAMFLSLVPATSAHAENDYDVIVRLDGRTLSFDVPARIVNNRTLVPLRFIGEQLGAEFRWDGSAEVVYANLADTNIVLPLGSTSPMVNSEFVKIDQPAFTENGRTMVPLRFVSEAFGAKVVWHKEIRTVNIYSDPEYDPGLAESSKPEEPSVPGDPNAPLSFEDRIENTVQASITMADGSVIVLELYIDLAPQSVRNFVYLARQGFYDGLTFHRIINGFMIQGGCPLGNGRGGPGYTIFGEFTNNGFVNELSHRRGILSMARGEDPDSAGSQFFIMHEDRSGLDGLYAAFGRVKSGMSVVDRIADAPNNGANGSVAVDDMPVIMSITIDDDIVLPEPNRLLK